MRLLNEYGKDIPKTWDELIDTAKYISKKEQEKGNFDLMLYNGLFPGMFILNKIIRNSIGNYFN